MDDYDRLKADYDRLKREASAVSYDDRHKIFADTTPAQRLGFAAWLVQNVLDGEVSMNSSTELTRACVTLREQQGLFGTPEE